MLIVVYGQDSFRALAKIREMKEKFTREMDELDTSFGELDGKILVMADLSRALATDSLFAKKRLVLIRNLMANKSEAVLTQAAEYLKNLQTENIVIFYEEQVTADKNKKVVWLSAADKTKALNKSQQKLWAVLAGAYQMPQLPLNDQELSAWIKQKLAGRQVTLSRAAERRLVAAVGADLWLMDNELEKLIAHQEALGGGEIGEEELKLLTNQELSQSIFDLTDAIGNRDRAKALQMIRAQLADNVAPLYLLTMLARQFKIILMVRQGLDNGQSVKLLAEGLKLHPYVLQKSVNQARNYNLQSLKAIMGALTKLDYNFKSGKWSVEMMLELLIARL
jgi:DNA polymerase-3 subunit delta